MSTDDGELKDKRPVPSTVEEVMARVRAQVPSAQGAVASTATARARPGEAYLFPEDVYRNLHQARTIAGSLSVDYRVGLRTPIVGHAWMLVRQRIHQEIRIYVDAMTTHQNTLNTHVLRALTQVVETLDAVGIRALQRRQVEQGETIQALRTEVQELRAQVETLNDRLATLEAARDNHDQPGGA